MRVLNASAVVSGQIARGISAPGFHGSVRNSLPLHGSRPGTPAAVGPAGERGAGGTAAGAACACTAACPPGERSGAGRAASLSACRAVGGTARPSANASNVEVACRCPLARRPLTATARPASPAPSGCEATVRAVVTGDAPTVSTRLRDQVTGLDDAWRDKRAPERGRRERAAATAARRKAIAGNWCVGAGLDDKLDIPGNKERLAPRRRHADRPRHQPARPALEEPEEPYRPKRAGAGERRRPHRPGPGRPGAPVALRIGDYKMSSDRTRHTARLGPGSQYAWEVSWLPGRPLNRDEAVTAMVIADTTASGRGGIPGMPPPCSRVTAPAPGHPVRHGDGHPVRLADAGNGELVPGRRGPVPSAGRHSHSLAKLAAMEAGLRARSPSRPRTLRRRRPMRRPYVCVLDHIFFEG